jgi:hypothetical protein
MEILRYLASALKGTPKARAIHKQALSQMPGIRSGVEQLEILSPNSGDDDDERPVFLFSAGWRSGSTLLQRLIMSDPRIFVWGEPYDHCGIVQALADTTKAFTADWPPETYYYDGADRKELPGRWIADLYPSPDDLKQGHRALFRAMLADPAKNTGASRWGFKEVRLGIEHAVYLRWLFPGSRFLFIYRNPLDAYRSYSRHGRSWYNSWPHGPVFTPQAFGRQWRSLLEGFLEGAEKVDGLVIPYEQLVNGGDLLPRIEKHLDAKLDFSVLGNKIDSTVWKGQKAWISRLEKALLRQAVSPLAEQLGYDF